MSPAPTNVLPPPTPGSAVPAVPENIALAYKTAQAECSPGHTFNLFFKVWDPGKWGMTKNGGKADGLKSVVLPPDSANMLRAVVARQEHMRSRLDPDQTASAYAVATSPFTTGLGIEHPLENGFAFLSPYGLPYLAGSGVKGVLRKAAEDGDELTTEQVELLFGTDNQAVGLDGKRPDGLKRGSLTFWDVFPAPASEDALLFRVEIMTPHHSDYLQKNGAGTPNDAEQPNPIPFLSIRPGSRLMFTVTCESQRLYGRTFPRPWKEIVDSLFAEAFGWLGFGAKTAVGYGAMERIDATTIHNQKQQAAMAATKCQWVDDKIAEIAKKPGVAIKDVLYGTLLAQAWSELSDQEIKAATRNDIKARWKEDWNSKLKGARKAARSIYGEDPS